MIPNPFVCIREPKSEACKKSRRFFRDLFETQIWARFVQEPVFEWPPLPDPAPELSGSSQLEPFSLLGNSYHLIGELLLNALDDPSPQPSTSSLISEIKRTGIQLQVIEKLIGQFEFGLSELQKEAGRLEQCKQ